MCGYSLVDVAKNRFTPVLITAGTTSLVKDDEDLYSLPFSYQFAYDEAHLGVMDDGNRITILKQRNRTAMSGFRPNVANAESARRAGESAVSDQCHVLARFRFVRKLKRLSINASQSDIGGRFADFDLGVLCQQWRGNHQECYDSNISSHGYIFFGGMTP